MKTGKEILTERGLDYLSESESGKIAHIIDLAIQEAVQEERVKTVKWLHMQWRLSYAKRDEYADSVKLMIEGRMEAYSYAIQFIEGIVSKSGIVSDDPQDTFLKD